LSLPDQRNGWKIGMMKRIAVFVALGLLASIGLVLSIIEGRHYYQLRHFAGYGPHIDVVLGRGWSSRRDTYYARLWNISVHSIYIEGCRLPGGYAGEGVIYTWDVQRWNDSSQSWDSLRGADHWASTPFGSFEDNPKCPSKAVEVTRIRPLRATVLGWVYKDWVTTGEPVRMAIHTSLSLPPSQQPIFYTNTFIVNKKMALRPAEDF
jgi:hypothetical protein